MELQEEIEAYIRDNWEQVVADIDALVRIPSVEDLDAAAPGAPYGPEPARALKEALGIARRMELEAHECEGYVGYADLPGKSATQICVLGHADVVPAGPGWTFPPYEVTRTEGYLVGRGVIDDKGPLVVVMHAANFWRRRVQLNGEKLPYTLRVLFGANEETGMGDIAYYRAHYDDPAFLFTPDAEFPVGYGEAGICQGVLTSAPIRNGRIRALEGGVAVNAVPGEAHARIAAAGSEFPQADRIETTVRGDVADVHAHGKAAHASAPHRGENAIDALAAYLLAIDALAPEERAFFEIVRKVTSHTDGSGVGLACADEHFGELTAVGSVLSLQNGEEGACLSLAIDFRYPTAITAQEIEQRMGQAAACCGAAFAVTVDKPPFLMDASSPAVQALTDAYGEVTGEDACPFTMKGGTYAREFACAVSFGPEKSWESKPAWVGALHAADEGISEGLLKQALAIYIRAIGNLMNVKM